MVTRSQWLYTGIRIELIPSQQKVVNGRGFFPNTSKPFVARAVSRGWKRHTEEQILTKSKT